MNRSDSSSGLRFDCAISHPVWSHHMPSAFPSSQTTWNTIPSKTVLSFRLVHDGVPGRRPPSSDSGNQSKPVSSLHVLGPVQMGTENRATSVHHPPLLGLPIHLARSTDFATDIAKKDQMDHGWSFPRLDDSPNIGWSFALHLENSRILCGQSGAAAGI